MQLSIYAFLQNPRLPFEWLARTGSLSQHLLGGATSQPINRATIGSNPLGHALPAPEDPTGADPELKQSVSRIIVLDFYLCDFDADLGFNLRWWFIGLHQPHLASIRGHAERGSRPVKTRDWYKDEAAGRLHF